MSLISIMRQRKKDVGEGWPPFYVTLLTCDGQVLELCEWFHERSELPEDSDDFDINYEDLWKTP